MIRKKAEIPLNYHPENTFPFKPSVGWKKDFDSTKKRDDDDENEKIQVYRKIEKKSESIMAWSRGTWGGQVALQHL